MKVTLPIMQCDPNCGECCGPAFCTESEFGQVRKLVEERGIVPREQGLTCPFYQEGTCQVYEARPKICKLFGHTKSLVCCKGYNTNISAQQERIYMQGYPTPTRCLHEFNGADWQEKLFVAHKELP